MSVQIVYAQENLIPSFYRALSEVAAERVYIEMIEPPAFEKVQQFQSGLIQKNAPVFYAVDGDRVVGWCDISVSDNPRLCHRGSLGMGIVHSYRGRGIGTQLMKSSLKHSQQIGLEKIELQVYTANEAAHRLYLKMGFVEEGFIRAYRKLDGITYDVRVMGCFLKDVSF